MYQEVWNDLTADERDAVVEQFHNLFSGRMDTYAIRVEFPESTAYVPSTYAGSSEYTQRLVRQITDNIGSTDFTHEAVRAHLEGRHFIGVYPISADSTVRWFALDFDGKDGDPYEEARAQAVTLHNAGLHVYIERSQSGNGYHIWGFLEAPMNAGRVRHALSPLIERTETYDRMFPNQDGVSATRPLGNLIALPLHGGRMKDGNSVFVVRGEDGLKPVPAPYEFLAGIQLNSIEQMEKLYAEAGDYTPEREIGTYEGDPEGLSDSFKLTHPVFGCEFVRDAWNHPDALTEPLWYALACNFAQLEDGRELFHKWSARDTMRYSPRGTDRKYDQALRANKPHTCEAIRGLGGNCTCDQRFPGSVYHPFDLVKVSFKRLVESVGVGGELSDTILTAEDGIERAILRLREIEKDPEAGQGMRYGITTIDAATRLRPSDLVILAARPGMGKALPNDCPVLTPSGWVRMDSLAVGDYVVGGDGQPTRVLGVYPQGKRQLYTVRFADGTSVECDDEHLWLTSTRADRRKDKMSRGTVKTLREIRETLLVGGKEKRVNHFIPWVAPVDFSQKALPIAPYVLGVLLGDGCLCKGSVEFTNQEQDVVERVRSQLPAGDAIRTSTPAERTPSHRIVGDGVRSALESLGLRGKRSFDKEIPEIYLWGDAEQRLALLQGLCDTDGYVYGAGIEYSTTSEVLANQVAYLARSLGGAASIGVNEAPSYQYLGEQRTGRTAYRVRFSFTNGLLPVTSTKHLSRLKEKSTYSAVGKAIVSVEPSRVDYATCILVDNCDHLFVTKDFIVTHNTAIACTIVDNLCMAGVPNYFFSAEMAHMQLFTRQLAVRSGVSLTRMSTGQLTSSDWAKLEESRVLMRDTSRYPLFVDDMSRSTERIFEIAARLVGTHGPGVIWVDYLQLLQRQPRESMFDAVTRITHDLKLLAKAIQCPVVALTQLNRTADDATSDSQTYDSWLRGSGDIEQAADVIVFLLGEKGPGIKERIFAIHKERHRESGLRINLEFHQASMRFAAQGTFGLSSEDTGDRMTRRRQAPATAASEEFEDEAAQQRTSARAMLEYARARDAATDLSGL